MATTSIRTTCGDIWLHDTIGSWYWDTYRQSPDRTACFDAIECHIVQYVNNHLPAGMTWFPALSEVYIDLAADADDDGEDERTPGEMISDLTAAAIAEIDSMLDRDPAAFGPVTISGDLIIEIVRDWLAAHPDEYGGYTLDGDPYFDNGHGIQAWAQDVQDASEEWADTLYIQDGKVCRFQDLI